MHAKQRNLFLIETAKMRAHGGIPTRHWVLFFCGATIMYLWFSCEPRTDHFTRHTTEHTSNLDYYATPQYFIDVAKETSTWLDTLLVISPLRGGLWKLAGDYRFSKMHDIYFYRGSAGVILFYLELYRHTNELRYLHRAVFAADHILELLPEKLKLPPAFVTQHDQELLADSITHQRGLLQGTKIGLYTGIAGVAFVLGEVYNATLLQYAHSANSTLPTPTPARYLFGMLSCLEWLVSNTRPVLLPRLSANINIASTARLLNAQLDVMNGAAGVGLTLLHAYQTLPVLAATSPKPLAGQLQLVVARELRDQLLSTAVDIGTALLSLAIHVDDEGGLSWRHRVQKVSLQGFDDSAFSRFKSENSNAFSDDFGLFDRLTPDDDIHDVPRSSAFPKKHPRDTLQLGHLIFPGFAHGTAGIGYFLARISQITGQVEFLEAALAAARHLLRIGTINPAGAKPFNALEIPHHIDPANVIHKRNRTLIADLDKPRKEKPGEVAVSLGWSHGPVGPMRLFYLLWRQTGDDQWRSAVLRAAATLLTVGIPPVRTDGYWLDNYGRCEGMAAIVEAGVALLPLVDRENLCRTEEERKMMRKLERAVKILARSLSASGVRRLSEDRFRSAEYDVVFATDPTPTPRQLSERYMRCWYTSENIEQREKLAGEVAHVGYMQGAAGIVSTLLHVAEWETSKSFKHRILFPDTPF